MRNPIKLLTSAGALILLTVSLNANAQHLPNFGFNDWKGTCGSSRELGTNNSDKESQRPGDEPLDWNGSSVNQLTQKKVLVTLEQENDNKYVKLVNDYIGLGSIGSNAPGYLTLGTPWVYAKVVFSNPGKYADGGTYGGLAWNGYKPSALRLKVKRTDTNDELSYIMAYMWNGTFTSKIGENGSPTVLCDDCDRAILGYAPDKVSGNGKLVAHLTKTFSSTANNDWETLTIPFEYDETAGEPSKINVIICCGNYRDRNALITGTTLYVDDVELVYPTKDYAGKCVTVDLTEDEVSTRSAANSEWSDAKMTVEDYGNVVSTDDTGHKTTTGKVTLGDVTLDGVKLTHYDDYLWLEHKDDNYTMDGSLHNNGNYLVYLDQPSANQRIKFADTQSATTGIESVDGAESEPAVFGGQGYVSVAGVHGMVSLYTLTGAKVAEVYVEGEAVIPATAGIVIVATPAGAVKCNVK